MFHCCVVRGTKELLHACTLPIIGLVHEQLHFWQICILLFSNILSVTPHSLSRNCYIIKNQSFYFNIKNFSNLHKYNQNQHFKGNSNFQGILNWILQVLLCHSSKQHKNIEKLQFNEQNIVIFFSVYCNFCFLRLSQWRMFFSSWTQNSPKF